MYLCGPIGIVLVQSNLLLWSKYVIGDEGALYPLMVTVLLGAAISAPIWTAGEFVLFCVLDPLLYIFHTLFVTQYFAELFN